MHWATEGVWSVGPPTKCQRVSLFHRLPSSCMSGVKRLLDSTTPISSHQRPLPSGWEAHCKNLCWHAFLRIRDSDEAHAHQTGENDHLWECEQWEMQRNEQGHDSPVFEAVSGLELSSNLKFYPSSGRGRLTHTAHIKASILCTHTHTHTNKHSDKKQCQYDLVGSYWESNIVSDQEHNLFQCLCHPVSLRYSADNCFASRICQITALHRVKMWGY